ncbi:MAG: pyruvate formate lyase family protein [Candidatus Omnitrophota bacterium]
MNKIAKFLMEKGEWLGAGFLEEPEASPMIKTSRAIRRQLENVPLPPYEGTLLYPSGLNTLWHTKNQVFSFHYSFSLCFDRIHATKIIENATGSEKKRQWQEITNIFTKHNLFDPTGTVGSKFCVGGNGYTHSIPNYGRVLKEGLVSYRERVIRYKDEASLTRNKQKMEFYQGLEDVLAGIKSLHQRIITTIKKSPSDGANKKLLLKAYRSVPFLPASNFYEALAATNFIFYLDGCDSLGRIDYELGAFYLSDLKSGKITHQKAIELMRTFWQNFDNNNGWNVAIGGSKTDGTPAYNELTLVCLEAARKMRRPSLALRIRKDMPDQYFESALDTIKTGCGLPALYNEELYLDALWNNHLNIQYRDISDYAFGGCTETMIHGKSNVGSLDGGINLLGILEETLTKFSLNASDFREVMEVYKKDLGNAISDMTSQINRDQERKAKYRPQPMRTLFIDDCLDAGKEYNSGGARYNWSVVNVGGLANVADSLIVINDLVYDRKKVSAKNYRQALRKNFAGFPELLKEIKRCPKYGNDEEEVDAIAKEVADFVFAEFRRYACWRGGHFLPGCLMFVTYASEGTKVMATPDGRKAREPIADSIGPYQGRDKNGPTAMLKSVAKLNQPAGIGTLILNMRFSRSFFDDANSRKAIKDMIRTYFGLGGMQIQITVVDQKILKDAILHPEKYEDLIIRIGGYSEYFNRLTPELKETVLARTEYNP